MKKINLIIVFIFIFIASCQKKDEVLQDEILATTEVTEGNLAKANIINLNPVTNPLPAFGLANTDYNRPGPYRVATIGVARNACTGLLGGIQRILAALQIVDPGVRCNNAFPYGFNSARVSEISYPANIESLGKLPVISFVGGLFSSTVNYDALVNLWVSHGFIVVNTTNFVNFSASLHVTGMASVITENRSADSPLYNKVDLSKVLVSGHSAGGGGAIIFSSTPASELKSLDPELKIIGSFPMQASFNAPGNNVAVPTLNLVGEVDLIVPPLTHPLNNQYLRMTQAPAWFITTRNSTHGTPTYDLRRNDYAGITVAWILYQAKGDKAASNYFVGPSYRALQDRAFVQEGDLPLAFYRLNTPLEIWRTGRVSTLVTPSPIRVQRNSQANALRSL